MARFQVGDEIIWYGDLSAPDTLRRGTCTRVGRDGGQEVLFINGLHKAEDCIYEGFCWPARVEQELAKIVEDRARLKKLFDDSIARVYELRNEIARGEK